MYLGSEYQEDSVLPDGTKPYEIIQKWRYWVVQYVRLVDEKCTFRHFPYGDNLMEQPAIDMEILDIIKGVWIELRNEDLKHG